MTFPVIITGFLIGCFIFPPKCKLHQDSFNAGALVAGFFVATLWAWTSYLI